MFELIQNLRYIVYLYLLQHLCITYNLLCMVSGSYVLSSTITMYADDLFLFALCLKTRYDNVLFVSSLGLMAVYVGGQQPGQTMDVGSNVLKGSFIIT